MTPFAPSSLNEVRKYFLTSFRLEGAKGVINPNKKIIKKKNYRLISLVNLYAKIFKKIPAN
jgi:hypothetical protein